MKLQFINHSKLVKPIHREKLEKFADELSDALECYENCGFMASLHLCELLDLPQLKEALIKHFVGRGFFHHYKHKKEYRSGDRVQDFMELPSENRSVMAAQVMLVDMIYTEEALGAEIKNWRRNAWKLKKVNRPNYASLGDNNRKRVLKSITDMQFNAAVKRGEIKIKEEEDE